jgi:hypothetical protein
LLILTYIREGGDRLVRLEKDKKDVWTKLPTSKKTHKMNKVNKEDSEHAALRLPSLPLPLQSLNPHTTHVPLLVK